MRILARGVVALLTLTVVTGGAAVVPAPSYAVADPDPVSDGAAWLAAHVPDDDPGLAIDVALALDAVDERADVVDTVRDAVAAHADAATSGSAAVTARAILLADATDADPADFGGVDLTERLESLLGDGGRVDADTVTQALGVTALAEVGSDRLGDATGDLLDRQCDDGSFRATATAECVDEAAATTAHAVLALVGQEAAAGAVDDALQDARNWLLQHQGYGWDTLGSFDGTALGTGLAARALGALGEDAAAERAAGWVRSRQLTDVGGCDYYDDEDSGAIAYDFYPGDVEEGDLGDFVRTTAQALPALQWAQAREGKPRSQLESRYVPAGQLVGFQIVDLAPGEAVCLVAANQKVLDHADATGVFHGMVSAPGDGQSVALSFAAIDGTFGSAELRGLSRRKLPVSLRATVARGDTQRIRVAGLAAAETVTVKVEGRRVARGQATPEGTFATSFSVTGKPRTAKVVVQGVFPGRTGTRTFRVTR